MKLGLHYWNYSRPADPTAIADTLAETARIAEQAGIASFTVMDHFFQMEGMASVDEPMLEGYTTLGYVAARTRRMTLGMLVTGVMYRYPGLLAKTVSTLDVLSGGRARLGIGASWYEREQRGLGVPVVPIGERFERLEETLQICRADVERRQRAVRGPALPAGRDALRARADQPAAPTDHDRRRGRAEDAAAGGPVRRRVQRVRHQPRRRRAQARRAARPTAPPRAATTTPSRRPSPTYRRSSTTWTRSSRTSVRTPPWV